MATWYKDSILQWTHAVFICDNVNIAALMQVALCHLGFSLSYFFIIDPTEYLSYKGPCICWLALFMVRFEVQYTIISLLCLLHLRSYVKQDTCFLALASQCSLAIVVVTVKLGGLCTEPHCHRDPALPPGCSTTTGL